MSGTTVGVVGGGALGVTAARDLSVSDAEVTLFERDSLGSGATGRAAGICYDAFAQRLDARIGARSIERFREFGVLSEHPYVWFAQEGDARVATAIREQVEQMQTHGRDVSLLSSAELEEQFPVLRTDDLAVCALSHAAGYVDPMAYVERLGRQAASQGATIRTATDVTLSDAPAVVTPDGTEHFDAVLVAAGASTADLLADISVDLALGTYRAQALETGPLDCTVPIYYDATERFYCRPADDGIVAGNGAESYDGDPEEYDTTGDGVFVDATRAHLARRLGIDSDVRRTWAGLCTATPDRDPLLGECTTDVYVATGWHGHGLMRAPALGEAITEQILGGDGIPAFDPRRFDGDETIDVPDGIVE